MTTSNHHHTATLTLPASTGSILQLAWSPGGTCLAAVTSRGYVCVWDISSGKLLLQKQVTRSRLLAVAWSHQGKALLLGSEHGVLSTLHLASQTLVTTFTFPRPITHIACSPNAITPHFFVATGQELKVFTQGKPEPCTLCYPTPILHACWNPDGHQIALVCRNGLAEVWDVPTRCVTWRQAYQPVQPSSITWEANGRRLAIGARDGTAQVQEIVGAATGEVVLLSRYPIQDVCWGERYLVASSEHDMAFWSGDTSPEHLQHATPVQTLAFDPHGTVLATAQHHVVALAAL
jgi:WD40 repeat protein